MRSRQAWATIDLPWRTGTVGDLLEEAIEIAEQTDRAVTFTFNGVKVWLNSNTKLSDAWYVIDAVKEGKKEISISR